MHNKLYKILFWLECNKKAFQKFETPFTQVWF